MQNFKFKTIGTTLEIHIRHGEDISHIFREISSFLLDFDEKFSRFKKDNWLFELNQNGENILDEHSRKMMIFMQNLARESAGFFDPTIGKRLTELGYGNQEIFFSPNAFNHRNFDEIIHFDENFRKIFIKKGFELEFGGVGKGYLIDWIYNFLIKKLPENTEFLINFGGDMACAGEWKVALESPFADDEAIGIIVLKNNFLACSAGTKRKFKDSHHLINPFSRKSATEVVAVFLIADTKTENAGMLTDGWATALSVMNFEKSCKFLKENEYLEGMIVEKAGEFFRSEKSNIEIF